MSLHLFKVIVEPLLKVDLDPSRPITSQSKSETKERSIPVLLNKGVSEKRIFESIETEADTTPL